jgi:hypothetical protein
VGREGKKKKFKRFSSEKNVTAIRRMCSVLSTLLQCARWVGAVTVGLGWHVRLALRCPKKITKTRLTGGKARRYSVDELVPISQRHLKFDASVRYGNDAEHG